MNPLPLSPIDHIFIGVGSYPIEFVFAYHETIDPARLRASLEETLKVFWPLRSHLEKISADSFGFIPAEDGLIFEVTSSQESFDGTENKSIFYDSVHSVEGEPLTKIKLTQSKEGSVLGVSISHALVDGFSFFHFMATWSRIFWGKRFLTPDHDRTLLIPENPDIEIPITPANIVERCGTFWHEKRQAFSEEQIFEEILRFSKAELKALFAEAEKDSESRLSYNDIVTALLWKKNIQAWNKDSGNPTVYISCPSDFRRILPGFARMYFGCAVCMATASMAYDQLVQSSLGELAGIIRKAVNQVKERYIREALETLERLRRQRGLGVMEEIHVMHPDAGFLVTNLSRLPVNDLDFGAGKPTGVQAATSVCRGAVVLPDADGLEVRIYHPVATN